MPQHGGAPVQKTSPSFHPLDLCVGKVISSGEPIHTGIFSGAIFCLIAAIGVGPSTHALSKIAVAIGSRGP